MLKIMKTKVFISKLEMVSIVVFLVFINISSKVELRQLFLDLIKFPESTCVCRKHPHNTSLSSRLQGTPQLMLWMRLGLWDFVNIIIDTSHQSGYNWVDEIIHIELITER